MENKMNATTLAKQYEKLTPLERLPLLLAASFRGDDAEFQRLMQSAPRVHFRGPHHLAVGFAFREVADFHHHEMLDAAIGFWAAYHHSMRERPPGEFTELFPLHACRFHVLWGAWREFCKSLSIDPDRYSELLPGWYSLRGTASVAALIAAPSEVVQRWFMENTGTRAPREFTVEDEFRLLREAFDARIAFWDK
jgi:hypothetical protein